MEKEIDSDFLSEIVRKNGRDSRNHRRRSSLLRASGRRLNRAEDGIGKILRRASDVSHVVQHMTLRSSEMAVRHEN